MKVLLIEPYYAGSHRQLIDLLHTELQTASLGDAEANAVNLDTSSVELLTMTGKKWHWRARTSALHLSQIIPNNANYRTIFASCVLPLHELLGLRPDLQACKKIIYFHENQLVYPVRKSKDRDFQYGYNQILSCLAADIVIFNSNFNKESFLSNLTKFFKLQPDYRPKNLREVIEPKCRVIYYPICFDRMGSSSVSLNAAAAAVSQDKNEEPKSLDGPKIYSIVWPHRWEFDKNPELFFQTIYKLLENGIVNFRLSILGENFTDNLEIFAEAKSKLGEYIDHFGYLPTKADYYDVLRQSDIVISTALHEFFGVAMMEAVFLGCFPLCPNRLVYPEIFKSPECIFQSDEDLFMKLKSLLSASELPKQSSPVNFNLYDWKYLRNQYIELFK